MTAPSRSSWEDDGSDVAERQRESKRKWWERNGAAWRARRKAEGIIHAQSPERRAATIRQARQRFAAGEVAIVHGTPTSYGYWGCRYVVCRLGVTTRRQGKQMQSRGFDLS